MTAEGRAEVIPREKEAPPHTHTHEIELRKNNEVRPPKAGGMSSISAAGDRFVQVTREGIRFVLKLPRKSLRTGVVGHPPLLERN